MSRKIASSLPKSKRKVIFIQTSQWHCLPQTIIQPTHQVLRNYYQGEDCALKSNFPAERWMQVAKIERRLQKNGRTLQKMDVRCQKMDARCQKMDARCKKLTYRYVAKKKWTYVAKKINVRSKNMEVICKKKNVYPQKNGLLPKYELCCH